MPKKIIRIFLLAFYFLTITSPVLAEVDLTNLEIIDLEDLYDSKTGKDLRKVFNKYLENNSAKENKNITSEYFGLFEEKFVVLDITPEAHKDYCVTIASNPSNIKVLKILLIFKNGEYQIKNIHQFHLTLQNQEKLKILIDKNNQKYWR